MKHTCFAYIKNIFKTHMKGIRYQVSYAFFVICALLLCGCAQKLDKERLNNALNSYADIIENTPVYGGSEVYGLIKLDKDDIPELYIIEADMHFSGGRVYYYNKTETVSSDNIGSFGSFSYLPKKSWLMGGIVNNNSEMTTYQILQDDDFADSVVFSKELKMYDETRGFYAYDIDGKSLPEKEYMDQYKDFMKKCPGKDKDFVVVEMDKSFKISEFDREDFINNYKEYIYY